MNESLKQALREASSQCNWQGEEEGGIIVRKDDDFLFVKLTNANTGTDIAAVLYTVHPVEYGDKIITLFDEGWENYASFHTHPDGCPARPSQTDLSKLFKGFQINYIFSPWSDTINQYTKLDIWEGDRNKAEGITHFANNERISWVQERIRL